ncbi:MAG TPA: hypothetical protein VFF88_05550 [Methylocella sp.]|nr:hypothetical protein [Methylocella sp.]
MPDSAQLPDPAFFVSFPLALAASGERWNVTFTVPSRSTWPEAFTFPSPAGVILPLDITNFTWCSPHHPRLVVM